MTTKMKNALMTLCDEALAVAEELPLLLAACLQGLRHDIREAIKVTAQPMAVEPREGEVWLLAAGLHPINVIKEVRAASNGLLGLKDAKDLVDRVRDRGTPVRVFAAAERGLAAGVALAVGVAQAIRAAGGFAEVR